MDEWTEEMFLRCDLLHESFVGWEGAEFKRLEVYRHPNGRCIERFTHKHIDADEPRETCRWLTDAEAKALIAQLERDGLQLP